MTDLASRLAALGFKLVYPSDPVDAQARWLGHAVREFQIYAAMANVARQRSGSVAPRWLDRLERVPNATPYMGPKNGDPAAPGFDAALQTWEANAYRCPVVVDVFQRNKGKLEPLDPDAAGIVGNFWRYDDPRIVAFIGTERRRAKQLHLRVCDLTGQYTPPQDPAPERMAQAGVVAKLAGGWTGGLAKGGADADEMVPDTLVGHAWAALGPAARSTFRVVRAASEFESGGRFDGLNAYDDATFSFGPCHWALAPTRRTTRPPADYAAPAGEAAGYFAFWVGMEPAESATTLLKPFGVMFKPAWAGGAAGASRPSWPTTRNYVGRIDWSPEDTTPGDPGKRALGDLDWLRTTHWFWRLLAMSRFTPSFRRHQWDMARLRLRDILAFQIDPSDRPGQPAGTKKVKLERIFTSEAAVALLLRCHIRLSGFLAIHNYRSPSLRLALAFADLPANPGTWGDLEQTRLIEGMLAATAFGGLTADEKKALRGAADGLPDHRAALAGRADPGSGLFSDCLHLAVWPRASDFRWSFKKPPPGKFALEQAACDPLSHAAGSFALDATALPPSPA